MVTEVGNVLSVFDPDFDYSIIDAEISNDL